MVRTNLSTRPFYNERLVRVVLGAIALAALGLTAFNVTQVVRLSGRNVALRSSTDAAEREAGELRSQGQAILQAINQDQLSAVQASAREANLLIDRRAFSWTELFNRFETTLPGSVRISAVQPQVDQSGQMVVAVTAVSRRVEDLDEFIEALEKTGAFRGVLSRSEEALEDGTLRSVVQGYYQSAAVEAPPTSDPQAPPSGNQTPAQARAEAPR